MASGEMSLSVNDMPIEIDYFVQQFFGNTIAGMLATLEGTGEIETLELSIDKDEVTINLNNALVPINPFVSKIFRNIITGMVSSLKGVNEINKVDISIKE